MYLFIIFLFLLKVLQSEWFSDLLYVPEKPKIQFNSVFIKSQKHLKRNKEKKRWELCRLPAPLPSVRVKKARNQPDQSTAEMAAEWTDAALEENAGEECSRSIPKRHARVTVKYNRKELQRRLDVEKWIDESLDRLYAGQVGVSERSELILHSTVCVSNTFKSFRVEKKLKCEMENIIFKQECCVKTLS